VTDQVFPIGLAGPLGDESGPGSDRFRLVQGDHRVALAAGEKSIVDESSTRLAFTETHATE